MTYSTPTSRSINAPISPVCAHSLDSVEQSCAATLIFEPSSRSHTFFNAVKTGAITTSQWFAFATKGFNASAVSTDSLTVLYIFQFPAITGLRMFSKLCQSTLQRLAASHQPGTQASHHRRSKYARCGLRRLHELPQKQNRHHQQSPPRRDPRLQQPRERSRLCPDQTVALQTRPSDHSTRSCARPEAL